jgi:hypothetical protein
VIVPSRRGPFAGASGAWAALFGAVTMVLGGCWEVTRPSLPREAAAPGVRALPSAPLPHATAAEEFDENPAAAMYPPAPPLRVGPVVQISEVVGTTPAIAGAMLAPAIEQLEHCQSPSKRKLVIQVIAERDRTHFRVVDQGVLEKESNRCVLEALSNIDVDPAMQQSRSASDAAPRIETQLILSW